MSGTGWSWGNAWGDDDDQDDESGAGGVSSDFFHACACDTQAAGFS